MKTSEKTGELVKALAKAQAKFPLIPKDKQVQAGARKYNYAELSTVIDLTKPVLLENGLVLTHGMESNGHAALTCRISHISGEWMESAYPLPATTNSQEIGSAITYGRRYTLCAMLGIATEDDDDGAQTTQPKTQAAAGPAKPYVLKPKSAPAPQPVESDDRVPASVTDGQAPEAVDGEMLQATILTTSKARNDSGSYGILAQVKPHDPDCKKDNAQKIKCSCGAEKWLNTFHDTPWNTAKALKGQLGVFTMKTNDKGFTNVEHLVGVQG
jgi:hypothetical protein